MLYLRVRELSNDLRNQCSWLWIISNVGTKVCQREWQNLVSNLRTQMKANCYWKDLVNQMEETDLVEHDYVDNHVASESITLQIDRKLEAEINKLFSTGCIEAFNSPYVPLD